MKAILEFSLPDEEEEYQTATKANSLYSSLWDFSQYLRHQLKYNSLTSDEYKTIEGISDEFYKILEENNISM